MDNCEVTKGYAFNAREDSVTQVRYIECLNELGSCKRSLCECDKALAYDLADMESEWNILHHQRWGQFDQQLNCKVHTATRDGALRMEKISEVIIQSAYKIWLLIRIRSQYIMNKLG